MIPVYTMAVYLAGVILSMFLVGRFGPDVDWQHDWNNDACWLLLSVVFWPAFLLGLLFAGIYRLGVWARRRPSTGPSAVPRRG